MSISTRLSIARAPDFTAEEPTDTLVLTGRQYFVDQRVTLTTASAVFAPSTSTGTPATGTNGANGANGTNAAIDLTTRPRRRGGPELSRCMLDWAFAGLRESVPDSRPGHSHCKWTHLVSSDPLTLVTDANTPVDEGSMRPHPDHPNIPELALEVGNEVDDDGTLIEYREVWWDDRAAPGDAVLFWEYLGAGGNENGHGNGLNRGFLGIVGRYAIGMGRLNGNFWTWRALKAVDGRGWEVLFTRGGVAEKPEGWALLGVKIDQLEPGAKVVSSSADGATREWICREAWMAE
ncbi:hypothetical protein TWF696_003456 [Orbilia brochopaga]|uniref:Protein HRI1 n=1 Tax=Orbilia brochopaga TaxID=3140254 RepID=A0AAV9TWX1_9PEZI